MAYVLISVSTLLILLALVLLVRNQYVFNNRMRYIGIVGDACTRDITEGKDWHWRWEAYESVSYAKMVFVFWRKADDFYDNLDWQK